MFFNDKLVSDRAYQTGQLLIMNTRAEAVDGHLNKLDLEMANLGTTFKAITNRFDLCKVSYNHLENRSMHGFERPMGFQFWWLLERYRLESWLWFIVHCVDNWWLTLPRGHCKTNEMAKKDGFWPKFSLSPMYVHKCETVECDESLGQLAWWTGKECPGKTSLIPLLSPFRLLLCFLPIESKELNQVELK